VSSFVHDVLLIFIFLFLVVYKCDLYIFFIFTCVLYCDCTV